MCAIVPVCRNSSQMPECGIPVAAGVRFGQATVFSDCALYAGFQPSRHNIGFDAAIGLKDAIKEKKSSDYSLDIVRRAKNYSVRDSLPTHLNIIPSHNSRTAYRVCP